MTDWFTIEELKAKMPEVPEMRIRRFIDNLMEVGLANRLTRKGTGESEYQIHGLLRWAFQCENGNILEAVKISYE